MVANTVPIYRLYREHTGESGDFWLHSETLSQRSRLHNWEISLHRHEALFQIFFLDKGEGELLGSGERHRFQSPCAIYIAPGSPHGFRYSHDAEGLVLTVLEDRLPSIKAADPAIAAFLSAPRIVAMPADGLEVKRITGLAAHIHEEFLGLLPGSNMLLDAMTTELVLRLARVEGHDAESENPTSTRERDHKRMHKLATLLAAHCREHRSVLFYAEKLGLSVPHLNRIARRETRASVQELAALHLIRAARRELIFTPTPVAGIAYSLGFQDPAYFNRFFKRETGKTPGQYREAERQKLAGSRLSADAD